MNQANHSDAPQGTGHTSAVVHLTVVLFGLVKKVQVDTKKMDKIVFFTASI